MRRKTKSGLVMMNGSFSFSAVLFLKVKVKGTRQGD